MWGQVLCTKQTLEINASHAVTITTHVPQQQHFPNQVHRGWQTYVRDLAKKSLFVNLKTIWASVEEGHYRKIPCVIAKVMVVTAEPTTS